MDPNYAGFLFVCFALLSLSGYLFSGKLLNLILFLIFSVSLILTFSRSSYIAFLIGLIIIGVLKSPKIIIYATVVSLLVFLTIPKAKVRIVGALTFDETSQARIESWRNAILVFKSSPVFGVGFNNYRFAQYRLGLFDSDAGLKVHSSGGSDSSLLFVAATTGIVGLLAYCFFLMVIILNLLKNARSSAVKLASASSFIALLVHSQFVNSLFFPPIMIVYFFMLGLSFVHDS
ncbi:O-antigen ligase family protein [Candidatus Curtissbacteria bacterium]|nr:O-antigen ligase family protein [Candidatus Curtissbacteria bacterium]